MILPVVVYGSPVLKKVARKIEPGHEGLKELIDNMFDTMYRADGIGLAAPQIGKSIRLIIIDTSPMAEDDPSLANFKKIIINPQIISTEGEKVKCNEGCLSLPAIREEVERKDKVKIEYYDENFQFHEEDFSGFKSRVVQHEYDHLEGILFIDRIPSLRKKLLNGKLNAIKKGKVDIHYKIKIPR